MPARPEPLDGVLAFAHRGGAAHPDLVGLENTAAAFRHAVALGYTHLETDLHLTRDGVLVAFHDAVLDRLTDGAGRIEDLAYDVVRCARVGGREQVPAFADLLEEFPHAHFNLDLKSDRAGAALAELLERTGATDRVLVGSFSIRRTVAFRRLTRGRVPTTAHPLEAIAFRLLPSARLARCLTRGQVAALQVPARRGPVRVVTPALVRRAHRAGTPVHVWTVDDPRQMHTLLALGVDGIMTDRTDVLRDVLGARGDWNGSGANQ